MCATTNFSPTIWRIFIDNKLFVWKGASCFDSREQAEHWLMASDWMKSIDSYVDYSQEFFGKQGDDEWRECFKKKILDKMNIEFKEYKCDE